MIQVLIDADNLTAPRLRALLRAATVIDPIQDGLDALREWFDAVLD